jgi:hypothetical protein
MWPQEGRYKNIPELGRRMLPEKKLLCKWSVVTLLTQILLRPMVHGVQVVIVRV